ncbi:3-oxoacyl-[acyl-carrier-protein] reductase FabG-like [Lineus longissimus]|uniref:3-oxoacyl-[acyl-carrier-protein] reductase FabG-like n=1 Tax=Lineus longissimus TaxID=88925 RepID=UPI002B4EAA0C
MDPSNGIGVQLDTHITKERFKGRVGIVTGGASGIGRATVERFANDGASVHFFDIDEKNGKALEASLQEAGHSVTYHNVNVTDKARCDEAVGSIAAENGGEVHMLFNNAACFLSKGLEATQEDWTKSFSVNVVGYSNMVQACYPYMHKGQGCAIVNNASGLVHRVQPNRWTYGGTKGAVWSMTRFMALDLSPEGIRVNSISPCIVWTPEVARRFPDRAGAEEYFGKLQLLRRMCEPAEVAATVAWLCSRDASFITAADIPVDGGYLAMSAEGFGDAKLSDRCNKSQGETEEAE